MKWHKFPDNKPPLCKMLLLYIEEIIPPGMIILDQGKAMVTGIFSAERAISLKKTDGETVYEYSNPLKVFIYTGYGQPQEIKLENIVYWVEIEEPNK